MRKLFIISFLILGIFALTGCQDNTSENEDKAKIILFVGEGCPHCENVEKYIKENKLEEKMEILVKEVFKNRDNLKVMEEKAVKCGLKDTSNLGVPFLWDGENGDKCYSGDKDIIKYLSEKVK